MRIEEISKSALEKAEDLELTRLRYKMSKFWDRHFKSNNNETVGSFKRSDFIAKYRLLLKEMGSEKRGLQQSTNEIDREAFKQSLQVRKDGIDLSPLKDIVLDETLVVLEADFAKADKIRVIINPIAVESLTKSIEDEIQAVFSEQFDKECEFVKESCFEGKAIPLYRQVLHPITTVSSIDFKQDTKEVHKSIELLPIDKANEERIVFGIVYEPDSTDAQGDSASAEEIQKAAYNFMENAQAFKVMHKGKKVNVKILENYLAPIDFTVAKRTVKKGSWVLVTRVVDDKLWQDVKAGRLTGYSMAGQAKVE